MTEDEGEILEEFIQESREHLAAIEPDLLEMERLGSETAAEIVNRVFRAIHSTKGGAAFLSFESLKNFSHVMENVLMLIRDGKLQISPTVIDALLRGVDVLKKMIQDVRSSDSVDCSVEKAMLEAIIRVSLVPAPVVVQPKPATASRAISERPSEKLEPPPVRETLKVAGGAEISNSPESEGLLVSIREAIAHGSRVYRVEVNERTCAAGKRRNLDQFVGGCGAVGKVLAQRKVGAESGAVDELAYSVLLTSVLEKHLLAPALGVDPSALNLVDKATLLAAESSPETLEKLLGMSGGGSGNQGGKATDAAKSVIAENRTVGTFREAPADVKVTGDSPKSPLSVSAVSASAGVPPVSLGFVGADAAAKPSLAAALTKVTQGPGARGTGGKDAAEGTDTLRVRVELLNQLMDSASELVLGRNQLLRALKEQAEKSAGLGIILQHIDRVTTDLQEGIMQTRMQQIGSLFSRYARVARDLGRQLGKNVELRCEGNHVELDKSIIEGLADPLTHIVRNAVDHAIEPPEERRRSRKPEVGKILLSASHESGQVKIVVEDDGRGIDRAKVLRKAIEKGLVTPAAAERITERDVINLLMMPGFSTADKISDVSGRGVGMDVVRTNVESLGGQIDIESEFGFGTSVQLRLPLTLAIIPSLIVGAGRARFAVPQVSIVELVWVRSDDEGERVQSMHGALTLRLRGRLLPLIRVGDILGGTARETTPVEVTDGVHYRKDYYILVLRAGPETYGLIVDELFESEEIVVKPLPQFLKGIDCFAGTTILGDGSVTMILDSSGLAARAGLKFASSAASDAAEEESRSRSAAKRSVIVFAGSPSEQYLVPQEQVLRLERIQRSDLQRTGNRDYICYRGVGLPLVRLEECLPVAGVPDFAEELYLLIPRMVVGRAVEPSAGILVWQIVDAVDLDLNVQDALFEGPGVKGATIVEGVLTTILDPVTLLQSAQPRKGRAA